MKILVDENTYLESDENQFILKKYTGKFDKKTEKEIFKVLAYCNTLNGALKHLKKIMILESDAETFQELLQHIKKIDEKIDAFFA